MKRVRFAGVPVILFGMAWVGAMGLVIVVLWNVLMPAILGLHAISYWPALGLLLLSRLLFGRFGPRLDKTRFVRGWKDLTPEERERFRRAMGPQSRENLGEVN